MNNTDHEVENNEESRIRAAYIRRDVKSHDSWFNMANLLLIQDRERKLQQRLRRYGWTDWQEKKVLEVGCGSGFWLREMIKFGANPENLSGIDLLPERIALARRLCPADIAFSCGNAVKLDFPDKTFDCVLQSTVFTSILDDSARERLASEMLRVLRPDGLILWYDFNMNNPWNSDVRRVSRREIRKLFPRCRIDLRRITLAPPLGRLVAPYSWLLYHLLSMVPFLCTHYLGVIARDKTAG
jgi:ubiquinone/menaquinone biosynthesis C-methylase UbiE